MHHLYRLLAPSLPLWPESPADPKDAKSGEREVQRSLRHILYVKYEMKDQDLFDKAHGYIAQYY
jgi:hypothetical protein